MSLRDLVLLLLDANDQEPVASKDHLEAMIFLCRNAMGVKVT